MIRPVRFPKGSPILPPFRCLAAPTAAIVLVLLGCCGLPSPLSALEPLEFPDPVPASAPVVQPPTRPGGFGQLQSRSHDEASTHLSMAQTQQALGRHREALELLREALRFDPGRTEIRELIGESCLALQEWELARQNYEDILAVAPGHADALARLGLALIRLDRHREATIALGNALLFGPTRPLESAASPLQWAAIEDRRLAEVQVRLLLGEEFAQLDDRPGVEQQIAELERLSHPAGANAAASLRRLLAPGSRR